MREYVTSPKAHILRYTGLANNHRAGKKVRRSSLAWPYTYVRAVTGYTAWYSSIIANRRVRKIYKYIRTILRTHINLADADVHFVRMKRSWRESFFRQSLQHKQGNFGSAKKSIRLRKMNPTGMYVKLHAALLVNVDNESRAQAISMWLDLSSCIQTIRRS